MSARWGHDSVYVEKDNAVYIVGGEISGSGIQITNEVLKIDLNTDNPSPETFSTSSTLSPTAFHSLTYSPLTNELITFGGLTSSCSTETPLHSFSLDSSSSGAGGSWRKENTAGEGLLRRRGAGMVWLDSHVADQVDGKVMIFGGMADEYTCASSTYYYTAFDSVALPLSSTPTPATDHIAPSLPLSGISDFALTSLKNNTVLFLGGVDTKGDMVGMDKVLVWNEERDWYALDVTGDVPVPRVGGRLVAHPTKQELLILHGGAVANGGTSTLPIPTVSLLNLTSLTWSTPAQIQPPTYLARAWHSNVITPSGVLVSSFGMGLNGYPMRDVLYLDMRHEEMGSWGWTRTWSDEMGNATAASASTSVAASASATGSSGSLVSGGNLSSSGNKNNGEEDDGLLKKVLPPTLIIGLILLGIFVWIARRHASLMRRRRMARHFEIENTHDEEGNRRMSTFPSALAQFVGSKGWRKSSGFTEPPSGPNGLPRPFGGVRIPDGDDNHSSSSPTAGLQGKLTEVVGILKRWSKTGAEEPQKQMMAQKNEQGASRVQWEEIDFGLGKVDEQRRSSSSPSRPTTPGHLPLSLQPSRQIPLSQFNAARGGRMGASHSDDETDSNGLPVVNVVPPSNPATPSGDGSAVDPLNAFPVLMPSPNISQAIERPKLSPSEQAEWDALERDVQTSQPFQTTGSVSSRQSKEIEPLPRLSFEEKPRADFSASLSSYGIGLGHPAIRRLSADRVENLFAGRSVSSPESPPHNQTISGMGYSPGYVRDLISGHAQSPARISRSDVLSRSATIAERPRSLHDQYQATYQGSSWSSIPGGEPVKLQRLSNPPPFPPPTSPLPYAPTGVARRVSAGASLPSAQEDTGTVRPVSSDRKLWVVNASPGPTDVDEFGSQGSHTY